MTDNSALYILNRDLALKTALQQNRTKVDGLHDVSQICYYDGEPFEDAPPNLISVPIENFIEFFSMIESHLPSPFLEESQEEQAKGKILVKLLEKVIEIRDIKQRCSRKIINETNNVINVSQKEKVNVHEEINDCDLYLFDRDLAHEIALRNNRIKLYNIYDLTQICYYDGAPFEDAPPNLVHVPVESFVNFFSTTGMRIPERFITKGDGDNYRELMMDDLMEEIEKIRGIKVGCYVTMIHQRSPDFINDKPWRVFMPVSRYTDVWQYCIKNLAKALQKMGCDVRVLIEEDDMHNIFRDNYQLFRQAVEFKPHIWISISQDVQKWLNSDMFHVNWWQDAPSSLGKTPVDWRERDILFSQYRYVDELLKKTGARQVIRQGIGIDIDVYKPMPEVERKHKVVFVGSSYSNTLNMMCSEYNNNDEIIEEIDELIGKGIHITYDILALLSTKFNIPQKTIYERHMTYVVRERAVEWLCQQKEIEFEVYGRYWEGNEIVRPFFKGELPYGEAVANVYNEATYALSLSAIEINTQRLAEIGACGCIPLVFDCRLIAEKPHWEDECLFFRNREELYSCLNRKSSGNPEDIGKAFSYDIFAGKILSLIEKHEGISAV